MPGRFVLRNVLRIADAGLLDKNTRNFRK